MSTNDPAESGSTEALRHEAARNRADLVRTVEVLAERARPTRLVRPATMVPVVAGLMGGLGVWLSMARNRVLRQIAWVGGIAAAGLAFVTARRAMAPSVGGTLLAEMSGEDVDVVDLLLGQHREIVAAFDLVRDAPEHDRSEAFAVLVDMLRSHERVEQRVVHPVVRAIGDEAASANLVADARVEEESAAELMLASLIANGVADQNFDAGLARLQQMVQDHAEHEESEEFPLLRGHVSTEQLHRMAGQARRNRQVSTATAGRRDQGMGRA